MPATLSITTSVISSRDEGSISFLNIAPTFLKYLLLCLLIFVGSEVMCAFELLSLSAVILINFVVGMFCWPLAVGAVLAQISLFAQIPREAFHYSSISSELVLLWLIIHWLIKPATNFSRIFNIQDPVRLGFLWLALVSIFSMYAATAHFLALFSWPWKSILLSMSGVFLLTPWAELFPIRACLSILEASVLYCLLSCSLNKSQLKSILLCMCMGSLAIFCCSLWELIFRDTSALYFGSSRLRGIFQDPNCLGTYLVGVLPLSLYLALSTQLKIRWLYWSLTAGNIVMLFFTYSRGAWAGGFCALMFLACSNGVLIGQRRVLRLVVLVIASVTFIAFCIIQLKPEVLRSTHISKSMLRVLAPINPEEPSQVRSMGRLSLWEDAWRTFQKFPIAGIGIGEFYRTSGLRVNPILDSSNPFRDAHNYLLQIGAEQGLIGLLPLIFIFALIVLRSPKVANSRTGTELEVEIFLKASCIALLTHAQFDHTLLYPEYLLLFSGLAAMISVARSSASADTSADSAHRYDLKFLAGFATLLFLILASRQSLQERVLDRDPQWKIKVGKAAEALWISRERLSVGQERNWTQAEQQTALGLTLKTKVGLFSDSEFHYSEVKGHSNNVQ